MKAPREFPSRKPGFPLNLPMHQARNHKRSYIVWALLNLAGLAGVLWVNSLAALGRINHISPAALADRYPNFFVPAGSTFSIWGLIYVLLLLFVLFQAGSLLPTRHQAGRIILVKKMKGLFLLSCLLNTGWVLAWLYGHLILSLALIILLLATLIRIYNRFQILHYRSGWQNLLLVQIPFSVYLGWITVATMADATVVLTARHWSGWGISPQDWTILLILIGALVSVRLVLRRQDIPFALVFLWADYGIALKRLSTDAAATMPIIRASALCMAVIAAVVLIQLFRKPR